MRGKDRHTANDQLEGAAAAVAEHAKSAEEYRQTADEHVKTLKDFWKDFLVSGIFILAAIVIIFACLAWFAANSKVSATGSSISAQGATFTMTAEGEGEAGAHVGYYERPERTPAEKEEIAGLSTEHSMTVTPSSNLNNNDQGGLYPGARGVITFTVKPISKNLQGVTIDISRILKTKRGVVGEADANALLNLIKGHLLFFRNMDGGGYYSGRIADSKIVINKDEFYKRDSSGKVVSTDTTEPVTVHLYWVWPEYIQNFVLVKDANYYKNLFADASSADYKELQGHVNTTPGEFYCSDESGTQPDQAPASLDPTKMTSSQMAVCAQYYNNADEYIGNNVTYLQLELNAREGVHE